MEQSKSMASSIVAALMEQRDKTIERGFYWENQIDFAYNSEKMEGNLLTKEQTRSIFETHTVSGKAIHLDHVKETENHFKLFDYMLDTLDHPLDIALIQDYHRVLESGTVNNLNNPDFVVGNWKLIPNGVGNIQTTPPADVDTEIKHLVQAYNAKEDKTYRDVTGFHVFFERIHPFQDGNGRVGRMIMFRECVANDLVPFIVLDSLKDRYYQGLQVFDDQPRLLIGYAQEMSDLYLQAYTSLLPEHLLLPDFERFATKAPTVSEKAQDFFEQTDSRESQEASL